MRQFKSLFYYFLIILFLTLPGLILAEENSSKPVSDKSSEQAKEPKIQFQEDFFDFGKIEQQKTVEHIFKFKNTGEIDLRIDHLKSTCGCTAALVTSKLIPPGGSGEIKVTFSSKNFQGEVKRSVFVFSNDPDNGKYTLNIRADVQAFLEANPKYIDFGRLKKGEASSRVLTVKNLSNEPIIIKEVKTDLKDIKIGEFEKEINPNEESIINLTLSPSLTSGDFFGTIDVTTIQHPERKLSVAASGKMLGDIILTPENLYFGVVKKGEKSEQKIKIANNGNTALKLIESKSDLKFIKLSSDRKTIMPKENLELTVSLLSEAPSGRFKGKIDIKTDNKTQPLLSIMLNGTIKD